jgi:hypothetical protein
MKSHAVTEAIVCLKSLARRRLRLSQALVRSTIGRRSNSSNLDYRVGAKDGSQRAE